MIVSLFKKLFFFFLYLSLYLSIFAKAYAGDTVNYIFPTVNIIGDKSTAIDYVPGTVNIVNKSTIDLSRSINGTQVFETIPGLNVVDEEGVGLRMNLSIRGLDPDRSRSILVLEDGMPTALAPYGEPEMYYTPLMDRMSTVEILKGSGSIIYGPQTIGGVVNFITNDPADLPGFNLRVNGGNGGFFNSKASYGFSSNNLGFLLEYNKKAGEKIGITNFDVNDLMLKLNLAFNQHSTLKFKFGVYDEASNSTYVGLTQNMYDRGEYFVEISPNDKLYIRRYAAQVLHQYIINDKMIFLTNAYGYTTTRNWNRQDFSYTKPSNWTGEVFGDTNVADGAIYMRNSTGNRDRQFEVMGVEPQLHYNYNLGGFENQLTTGVRFHYERAFEQRINGKSASAIKGDLVSDEIRTGYAGSAFIQNRLFLFENLIITPGLRFERFNYERQINRTSSKDTLIRAESMVSSVIPGIGINYNLIDNLNIFGGVHKGFAPPRTKDAISNSGESLKLDAELSWNSELGFRTTFDDIINLEITAYRLDFSNQIIPVSESSGGLGADVGYVNGGATRHQGIETSIGLNISNILKSRYLINFNATVNYGKSEYTSDRFINVSADNKVNIIGNELPYAPKLTISTGLIISAPFGTTLYISSKYQSEQFTDELNSINPSANGRTGLIDGRIIFNSTIEQKLNNVGITLFVSVKNIFDERYISSRRPQGIKVGLPRMIIGGIDFNI